MKPWQIGNTSVRSGTRLRDGLIALRESGLEGSIRGAEGDRAWRDALGRAGVVTLGIDDTASVGRKWRSALEKLGFIYGPDVGSHGSHVGPTDFITPSGERLMSASSLPAQQESFLRALAGFWLTSDSSSRARGFSPLLHTLKSMQLVKERTGSSTVSFVEFCVFINSAGESSPIDMMTAELLETRKARIGNSNVRRFDMHLINELTKRSHLTPQTHRDYADMNLRYLKATGLFQSRGRGIEIRELSSVLVQGLLEELRPPNDELAYWRQLTDGVALPTDSHAAATSALQDVIRVANERGLRPVAVAESAKVADLNLLRFEIEESIARDDEEAFAAAQVSQLADIHYFFSLIRRNRLTVDDPFATSERPAYLEWTVWRAFLAINHLRMPISESRRFNVDQQVLPIGTAPGGGPDLVFHFDEFVLIVEVTLLTSFRQEAAEGHSVREHTFREIERKHGKPVYCLFIAPSLFIQTIETFRDATYWSATGSSQGVSLDIVPVTLEQFEGLFEAIMRLPEPSPDAVLSVLRRARKSAVSCMTPIEWQTKLNELFASPLSVSA